MNLTQDYMKIGLNSFPRDCQAVTYYSGSLKFDGKEIEDVQDSTHL